MKSVFAFVAAAIPMLASAQTGPETEDRFPPLKLPPGFEAQLFACDPLVEYPSVIALGPKPGTLFVAHDYMTGLGREIVRRDEIRLLADTDGDGYADTSTVYAEGFNSIEGLEFFDGEVFAMHAPFLTKLRDTDGDGVADERENLLSGLGLPPEENDVRLHCANGVTAGFDNWLYLAMGDHGVDIQRPEGDRLVLNGGGILRCRRDGSDLHIFAKGTRNIYDVALDADLNVFIRDNENDGGNFKIRVSHSFFGADHGYPYLFRERPDELLKPLADLGLGSSAGGACYLETAFPVEYRGNLFFAEWGKSIVRYPLTTAGSSFGPTEEHEFAVGDESDTYPFKPTDVVVDRDGSLLISDWADGQRPNRGRARIYRIRYADAKPTPELPQQLLGRLDSPSAHVRVAAQLELAKSSAEIDPTNLGTRGRVHAVWLLADNAEKLLEFAEHDAEPAVRLQAIRALGDLGEVTRLPEIGHTETDSSLLREITIALARARWDGLADWIRETITEPDLALIHAAKQMLRRSDDHAAILELLDLNSSEPARKIALQALADWIDTGIADDLISRLQAESEPSRQRELAHLLTRIHRKPGPWVYWEYRPAPRLPNPIDWERTGAIADALNEILLRSDFETRSFVLSRMRREKIDAKLTTLTKWLKQDFDEDRQLTILHVVAAMPKDDAVSVLKATVSDGKLPEASRLLALRLWLREASDDDAKPALRTLLNTLPDDKVLAEIFDRLMSLDEIDKDSADFVAAKLSSDHPAVRATALRYPGLAEIPSAAERVLELLGDSDPLVQAHAALAAGRLQLSQAIEQLLGFAEDESNSFRRSTALIGLNYFDEPRAIPLALASLDHPETQQAAVDLLGEHGELEHGAKVVDSVAATRTPDTIFHVASMFVNWMRRMQDKRPEIRRQIGILHGRSEQLAIWFHQEVDDLDAARDLAAKPNQLLESGAPTVVLSPRSSWDPAKTGWVGAAEVYVEEPTLVQFLASAKGALELWLNGEQIYTREQPGEFRSDSDRVTAQLNKGTNYVCLVAEDQFQARFRRKSTLAEHEELIQNVLGRTGNPELGRELFFDVEVTQCALCHRIEGEGGQIGPSLNGAGSRFSQIYLLESILEPSRALAPSFHSHLVTQKDGIMVFGTKIDEDEDSITIGDAAGQRHRVLKSEIQSHDEQQVSIMPPGLEKRMTPRQLTDLLAFLLAEK